ncbi:VMAP-C domain-containing protein [Streptomyces daliensis]
MSALEELVRRGVVRIGRAGDGYDGRSAAFWGSGFFVAPEWVLTCAHVVAKGAGAVWRGERVIGVTTADGVTHTGELAFGLPAPADPEGPPAHWPLPDVALIRVPGATDPDCLWLSDRSSLTPAEIGLYGWTSAPGGGQVYLGGTGMASGGSGGPLVLRGGFLPPGCSGGPVVDLARGAVIGLSKGQAKAQGGSGLAVPATSLRALCDEGPRAARLWHEVLRAHDRHHLRRYLALGASWPRTQVQAPAELRPYGFTPDRRTQLYGLLGALAPPGSAGQVLEMVNDVRRLVLQSSYAMDTHAPRGWREGAGLLYAPHDGQSAGNGGPEGTSDLELEAVVLYAAKVCAALSTVPGTSGAGSAPHNPGLPGAPGATALAALVEPEPLEGTPEAAHAAHGALRDWVLGTAVTLQNEVVRAQVPGILDGARAARAAHADVLIEIDPDVYGTHAWRVKLLQEDGQITPVRHNETGVPREELERDIRAALATALDEGDVGEHLAAVDFMVPRGLFDEPLDEWRARPPDPGEPFNPHTLPLGRRRLVVLRDGLRWRQGLTPEWRSRWNGAAEGPLETVPLRGEVLRDGHEAALPESDSAVYGRLSAVPPGAVPVHCSRTSGGRGAGAMTAALTAGHAVALWRRCDETHTDCAEFHDRAAALLAEAGTAHRLPERIRTLRNLNADPAVPDPDSAWARDIVLIYDPPHGPPLPDGPLRAPRLRPGRPS